MIPPKLTSMLERLIERKFFGDIVIKFNKGNIVHVTRTESIKVDLVFTNNPDTKVSVDTPNDIIEI